MNPPSSKSSGWLLLLFSAIFLAGCGSAPDPNKPVGEYKAGKLLEIDGITVYRFLDDGHYIYVASRGSTSYPHRHTHSNGKTTTTTRHYMNLETGE